MKEGSELIQRFHFNSTEVKQALIDSPIYNFNSSKVKHGSGHSKLYHFNSSEVKLCIVFGRIIVIIMNQNRVLSKVRDLVLTVVKR